MDLSLRNIERAAASGADTDYRRQAHALRRAGKGKEGYDLLLEGLRKEIETAKVAETFAYSNATTAGHARYKADGGCLRCKGYGEVQGMSWDSWYPCCSAQADSSLLSPTTEEKLTMAETRSLVSRLEAEWDSYEVSLEKGSDAVYSNKRARAKFKTGPDAGSKVPVGTTGLVIWHGDGQWGERVGIKTENGSVFWTSASNVETADPWGELAEEAWQAELSRRFPRGSTVRAQGRTGEVFWKGDGRVGVRPFDAAHRDDVVWANLDDLESVLAPARAA